MFGNIKIKTSSKYNVIEGGDQRGVTVSQWGCEKREKTKEREEMREFIVRKAE